MVSALWDAKVLDNGVFIQAQLAEGLAQGFQEEQSGAAATAAAAEKAQSKANIVTRPRYMTPSEVRLSGLAPAMQSLA
jgi:hypothetical protein